MRDFEKQFVLIYFHFRVRTLLPVLGPEHMVVGGPEIMMFLNGKIKNQREFKPNVNRDYNCLI